MLALAARQGAEAGLQVLLDGQQREDLAALRHQRDAAPGALDRGQAGDVLALPLDPAGRRPDLAHDGAQRAGLADAVAAEHAGDLADHRGERHPPQRLAGAVVQVDALDTQHAQRPR